MAVVFNEDGLQKQVNSNLKNSKTYLTSAKNILSSIDIPNNFRYYTQLKNYPKNISDIEKNIKEIQKWLEETIINFKNAEINSAKKISKLATSIINSTTLSLNESIQNSVDTQVSSMSDEEIEKYWNSHIENKTKTSKFLNGLIGLKYDEEASIDSYTKSIDEQVAQMYHIPIEEVTTELRVKVIKYNKIKQEMATKSEEKTTSEKIADGLKSLWGKAKKTGASITNGFISLAKGFANLRGGNSRYRCYCRNWSC